MTTEKIAEMADSDMNWDGNLTLVNLSAVVARLRRMLTGHYFTFVRVDSPNDAPEVTTGVKMTPGQRGDDPIIERRYGHMLGFMIHHEGFGSYIITGTTDDVEPVYFRFSNRDQFYIDQIISGNRVRWSWAVERNRDHLRLSFTTPELVSAFKALRKVGMLADKALLLKMQDQLEYLDPVSYGAAHFHGPRMVPRLLVKLKVELWADWLTDLRLARWNHLRQRAAEEPITRDAGARFLMKLANGDSAERRTLDEIKARIAE